MTTKEQTERINALIHRLHAAVEDEFPEEVHAAALLFFVASKMHIRKYKSREEVQAWELEVLAAGKDLSDDEEPPPVEPQAPKGMAN